MTEFFDPPAPELKSGIVDSANKIQDTNIKLGGMPLVLGKAFATRDANQNITPGAVVFKDWLTVQGRTFLVEKLPYQTISEQLQTLPLQASLALPSGPVKLAVATPASNFTLPPSRPLKHSSGQVLLAKADYNQTPGVVLDYMVLSGVISSNFTFQADSTYLMNGSYFEVDGLVTFEGSAVIKFSSTVANFKCNLGGISCQTSPYRPLIMTASDDNTVGEVISGSTGTPSGYYGGGITIIENNNIVLHDIRVSYLGLGFNLWTGTEIDNLQMANCNGGLVHAYVPITINNALFYNIGNIAVQSSGSSTAVSGTQLTIDNCNIFADPTTASLTLANSLVTATATTNLLAGTGTLTTNNVTILASSSGIYQVVGAGTHYLATNSPYRSAGTNNINAAVLASLSARTTYPPLIYSNQTFTVSTNLQLQALRDTNTSPALGYHYDPLDYITDNLTVTNATLTITNGIAIACYNEPGITLQAGATINSIGTPLLPNWLVRYQSVQDAAVFLGGTNVGAGQNVAAASLVANRPSATFQFTHFATPANGGFVFNHNGNSSFNTLTLQHSEVWGGTNNFSGPTNAATVSLMNNLFFRSGITASNSAVATSLAFTNNLIYGTVVSLIKPASGNWNFFNNDVDSCTVDPNSAITNGYNAFINCSASFTGTNNLISTNLIGYQTGPLGIFYQPTNSYLINTGSVTANLLALGHFTTLTNQTIESNTVVDIGYHYVALGTNGLPLTDTNGIPFYLEDAGGAGGSTNLPPVITGQPANYTAILSNSANFSVTATGTPLLRYQWWFNATNILAGATNATLMLNNVQLTNAGNYSVVITNNFGAVTSSVAVLTVPLPVVITAQPTNLTVPQGSNATFSVTATGTAPLAYQWYFNATNLLAGATNSSVTLTNVQTTNAGNYTVVVTNLANSVTSSIAVLSVSSVTYNFTLDFGGTPIVQPFGNDWNTVNNWNPFGLSASGSEASYPGSTYELKVGERLRTPVGGTLNVFPGKRLTVDGGGIYEDSTLTSVAELRLKGATGSIATNYFTELMLSGGQVDNVGQPGPLGDLQVIQGQVTVRSNSVIYADAGSTYDQGLRIDAWLTGSGNLFWHQYGGSLGGTNLQIACATNNFNGQWVVDQGVLLGSGTNSLGTNNIIVGTNGLAAAVETLYDIHNTNGNLVLGANGKVLLHQNDVFGGVKLNGTALAPGVYTFTQLNATNSAMFPASWAVQYGSSVSSASGSITVIGTVGTAPVITVQPTNYTAILSNSASFSVSSTGTTPLIYQWWFNATNVLAGATNTSLTLSNVQLTNGGNYTVVITNTYGAVTSSIAVLTVVSNSSYSITITNPASNSVFAVGSSINLGASVSGVVGTVAQVQFFQGVNSLGIDTNAPYSMVWTNAGIGRYALTARATDNNGLMTTSSVVTINVLGHLSGMTFWWKGESNTLDSVGTNNGVLQGGAGFTNGEVGQSFNFSGATNCFMFTPQLVAAPQSFTIECWFKTTTTNGGVLLGFGDSQVGNSPNNDHTEFMDNAGKIHFAVYNAGFEMIDSAQSYNDGNWHHAAVTMSATNGMNLYIDATNYTNNPTATGITSYNGYWRIGENRVDAWPNASTSSNFMGAIDELAIYNRPLTSNEISTIYGAGSVGKLGNYSVALTNPRNGDIYLAGANIGLGASTSNGVATSQMQYFQGTSSLGVVTNAPYGMVWSNVTSGTYTLTAQATDIFGLMVTSPPVSIMVVPSSMVIITNPINYAAYGSGANITIGASAVVNGTVTQVQLFQGTNSIGLFTNGPYSLAWSNLVSGNYAFTAVATDNHGINYTSSVVTITLFPTNNLTAWLKADAIIGLTNAAPVASWPDSSCLGNNATQASTSQQPLYLTNILNGFPTVRFDGTNDQLMLANYPATNNFSVFVVTATSQGEEIDPEDNRTNASGGYSGEHYLFGGVFNHGYYGEVGLSLGTNGVSAYEYAYNDFGSDQWGAQSVYNGYVGPNFSLVGMTYSDQLPIVNANGQTPHFGIKSNRSQSVMSRAIGYGDADSTQQPFSGDVAEIMIFNRVLTPEENQIVGTYLSGKYALSLYVTNGPSPTAPTNFMAAGVSPSQLNLQWVPTSTNYYFTALERKLGTNGIYQVIAQGYGNFASFSDTNVFFTNQYFYLVKTESYFGQSGYSAEISPPVVSLNLLSTNAYILVGSTNYLRVQALDADNSIGQLSIIINNGNTNLVVDARVSSLYTNIWIPIFGQTGTLTATAVDSAGNSWFSAPVNITAYLDSNSDGMPDFLQVLQGNDPMNPWVAPAGDTNTVPPTINLLVPANAILLP